mmetsp:Transcript_6011/g.10280  ORF Transcript_6011/g.10280 Transcript_6011/m.10280 type:complete len:260 (+) Transcript_6011:2068-2847(+)
MSYVPATVVWNVSVYVPSSLSTSSNVGSTWSPSTRTTMLAPPRPTGAPAASAKRISHTTGVPTRARPSPGNGSCTALEPDSDTTVPTAPKHSPSSSLITSISQPSGAMARQKSAALYIDATVRPTPLSGQPSHAPHSCVHLDAHTRNTSAVPFTEPSPSSMNALAFGEHGTPHSSVSSAFLHLGYAPNSMSIAWNSSAHGNKSKLSQHDKSLYSQHCAKFGCGCGTAPSFNTHCAALPNVTVTGTLRIDTSLLNNTSTM